LRKKVDFEETVLGGCKQCKAKLSANKTQLFEFQNDIVVVRSNMSSELDISHKEYIELIKILTNILYSKIINRNIPETELYNLSTWGYLSDVKLQYDINNLVIQLLEDWPYNIINYLHNNLSMHPDRVIIFLHYFIRRVKQPNVRKKFREALKGFGSADSMTEEMINKRKNFK